MGLIFQAQPAGNIRAVAFLFMYKRRRWAEMADTILAFLAVISFSYSLNFHFSNYIYIHIYIISILSHIFTVHIFFKHMPSANQFLAYISTPSYTGAQSRFFGWEELARCEEIAYCSLRARRGYAETKTQACYGALPRLLLTQGYCLILLVTQKK